MREKAWNCAQKVSNTSQLRFKNQIFLCNFVENTSVMELNGSEQIVATATITIPNDDGPIEAISTIESVPNSALYNKFRKIESDNSSNVQITDIEDIEMTESAMSTPQNRSMEWPEKFAMPSAPPLEEVTNIKKILNLPVRHHEFTSRTILRSESCSHCAKK